MTWAGMGTLKHTAIMGVMMTRHASLSTRHSRMPSQVPHMSRHHNTCVLCRDAVNLMQHYNPRKHVLLKLKQHTLCQHATLSTN